MISLIIQLALGAAMLGLVIGIQLKLVWDRKIHPDTSFTQGWCCFWLGHRPVSQQRLLYQSYLFSCHRCHGRWERETFQGHTFSHPWTAHTEEYYTMLGVCIAPMDNAPDVPPRKVLGNGTPPTTG